MSILGHALQGFGGALEHNAKSQLEEQREQRLMALRERYAIAAEERAEEREGRQYSRNRADQLEDYGRVREDTLSDRQQDRDWRIADRAEDRGWAVEDRNFNASEARWRTTARPAAGSTRLDPLFNAQLRRAQDQRNEVYKLLNSEQSALMSDEQRAGLRMELNRLDSQLDDMLGMGSGSGGGSGNLASDLADQLGLGGEGGGGLLGGVPAAAGGQEEIAPPPRNASEVDADARRQREDQDRTRQERAENNQARAAVRREINALQQEVANIRNLNRQERDAAAASIRESLGNLYDSGRLDADERRRAERLIRELSQYGP